MRYPILLLAGLFLAACSQSSDTYLPLDSGQTLTYNLTQTRSGDTLHQKRLSRIEGPITIDGREVYQEYTGSGTQRLLERGKRGIAEVGYSNADGAEFLAEPQLLLPQPLTADCSWQAPVSTQLLEWRKHSLEKSGRRFRKTLSADFKCTSLDEQIETPAGRFDNVARIEAHGRQTIEYGSLQEQAVIHVELTRWYAPGVGLIKSERREYADSRELNPGEATLVLERID